jgi:hypothetical protein
LITLGLYRLQGASDNDYPYIYTNPEQSKIINSRDRVFVLGRDIPRDLIIDHQPVEVKNSKFGGASAKNMPGASIATSARARNTFYGNTSSPYK